MRCKPTLSDVDWLRSGFSRRDGGVSAVYGGATLNLGWTETDNPARVTENRRRFARQVWGESGEEPELVTLRQVHSAETVIVGQDQGPRTDERGRTRLEGDGLMTDEPELLLGIQTADCVPVLVADTRLRVVAGFHAGWRGTVGRIVEGGVRRMGEVYGSRAEDLVAAVGPAIGICCYAVSEDVRGAFEAEFRYAAELFERREERARWQVLFGEEGDRGRDEGALYLDLHESNRRQLIAAGVGADSIEVMRGECTACTREADGTRRYFSHRAERGLTGRMMSGIGIASR